MVTQASKIDSRKRSYLINIIVSVVNVGYDATWLLDISYKKIDFKKLRQVFIDEYMADTLKMEGFDTIDEWKDYHSWFDRPLNNFK